MEGALPAGLSTGSSRTAQGGESVSCSAVRMVASCEGRCCCCWWDGTSQASLRSLGFIAAVARGCYSLSEGTDDVCEQGGAHPLRNSAN